MLKIDQMMRTAQPGTMAYGRFHTGDGQWETGLFIREDKPRIKRLGKQPTVEVRAGMFQESGVYLLAIMVQVGGELYETWLNYHQRSGGAEYVADLMRQDRLALLFYGPAGRERGIRIRNPLQAFAQEARGELEASQPWSMTAFDQARERLYNRYPTVQELWNALDKSV